MVKVITEAKKNLSLFGRGILIVANWFFRKARGIDRFLSPVIDIRGVSRGFGALVRYPKFILEYIRYRIWSDENVPLGDLYPCLHDLDSASQSGRGHYFYQDIWALSRIVERMPEKHVDVGSRIDGFAGQLSAILPVEYIDIRPVELSLENFNMLVGSLLALPYAKHSISSLSCLHVLEHVGLGRYGDPMIPHGSRMAAEELIRVLAPQGHLFIGIPIGRERVAFNAHRVFSPLTVASWFSELNLVEFSIVTDEGLFRRNANLEDYFGEEYACGLFLFKRVA